MSPNDPEGKKNTYRNTIRHAASLCGGIAVLAARLGVDPALAYAWHEGNEAPPTEVFLRAVDLILAGKVDARGV